LVSDLFISNYSVIHCFGISDEALAVSMLKATKEFSDAALIRTRDASKLAECDVVVDVGGVYDPATHRYDHHQVSNNRSQFLQNNNNNN
jgi:uncharacterized UPF0160 family protein